MATSHHISCLNYFLSCRMGCEEWTGLWRHSDWNSWAALPFLLPRRGLYNSNTTSRKKLPRALESLKICPGDPIIDGNQGRWHVNLGMRDPFLGFLDPWLQYRKFTYLSFQEYPGLAREERPHPEPPPTAQRAQAVRTTVFRIPQASATASAGAGGPHYPMNQASCPPCRAPPLWESVSTTSSWSQALHQGWDTSVWQCLKEPFSKYIEEKSSVSTEALEPFFFLCDGKRP